VKVRPVLLWILVLVSAFVGALAGIVFEGLLDKYLLVTETLRKNGVMEASMMGEVLTTGVGAALGAAFVGLTAYVIYRLFFHA
jgi:hypothetical protein